MKKKILIILSFISLFWINVNSKSVISILSIDELIDYSDIILKVNIQSFNFKGGKLRLTGQSGFDTLQYRFNVEEVITGEYSDSVFEFTYRDYEEESHQAWLLNSINNSYLVFLKRGKQSYYPISYHTNFFEIQKIKLFYLDSLSREKVYSTYSDFVSSRNNDTLFKNGYFTYGIFDDKYASICDTSQYFPYSLCLNTYYTDDCKGFFSYRKIIPFEWLKGYILQRIKNNNKNKKE